MNLVCHTLHYSLFAIFCTPICDAPWLSLKSVLDRVFGDTPWTTSWCIQKAYMKLHSPESHTSVLRMIPKNFLFNVTLCYDKSCTRATLFSVFSRDLLFSWQNGFLGGNRVGSQSATRSRKHILMSGNWMMMDQNVTRRRRLCANNSLCLRFLDCAFKYEQPLDASSAPKSSWRRTSCFYLETLRNRGYFGLLGKTRGTIASPKARV